MIQPTITAEATSAAGADVTYTVDATDVADPDPTVGCSPLSGSTFPLGTTSVDWYGIRVVTQSPRSKPQAKIPG